MMECGAKGFMLKDSEYDQVIEAVKTVYAGGTYFSESLLESLAQSLRVTPSLAMEQPDEDRLSEREVEILVAICRGLSTQEIADELYISKRTVDKHRANILEKSGCKNTASLVVYAIKNGIVEL
jgi:DNA-binding NarL/FixJ family response regulator